MLDLWDQNGPPVYLAVAGYLGLIKTKGKTRKQDIGTLEDLVNEFGATGGMIQ